MTKDIFMDTSSEEETSTTLDGCRFCFDVKSMLLTFSYVGLTFSLGMLPVDIFIFQHEVHVPEFVKINAILITILGGVGYTCLMIGARGNRIIEIIVYLIIELFQVAMVFGVIYILYFQKNGLCNGTGMMDHEPDGTVISICVIFPLFQIHHIMSMICAFIFLRQHYKTFQYSSCDDISISFDSHDSVF